MRFGREREEEENYEGYFFNGEEEDFNEPENLGHEFHRSVEAELGLVAANLNRKILVSVVKTLETSWWWKFTCFKTKLSMISESYKTFSKLISESEEEEE